MRTLLKFDEVLGLGLDQVEPVKIPKEITELAEKREQARTDKDWEASDKIRADVESKGYLIDDTDEGFIIKKKR